MQDNHRGVAVFVIAQWWLTKDLYSFNKPCVIAFKHIRQLARLYTLHNITYFHQHLLLACHLQFVVLNLYLGNATHEIKGVVEIIVYFRNIHAIAIFLHAHAH